MSGKQRLFAYFSARRPRGGAQPRLIRDRYQLLSVLGRGGMGTVWLAEDTRLHRQVAVKELRVPDGFGAAEPPTHQERALREARSAARIMHVGAVTLFDAIPGDGAVYLIMELVEGMTLKELIDRDGALPAPQVAGYGLQLLDVLAAAHALGIVHRDVKPANIMITSGGQVKLSDFGLAHTVGDPRLTGDGVVMGTHSYLPPELFEGNAPITPAADLWSLGATLYHTAVGRGPFERDTTAATLRAIVMDDPPVPRCAPALADAITALLRRYPHERATIDQARRLLRGAVDPPPAAGSLAQPRTGQAPASATAPATGPWPVASAGPRRGWDPGAVTGRHDAPLSGVIPAPSSAGIPGSKPRVMQRPWRRFRLPGGRRAVLAVGALLAAIVVVAVILVVGPGGGAAPAASGRHTSGTAPECTAFHLSASAGPARSADGYTYQDIDFTNTSRASCTLYGYPGVALATGPPVSQVGTSADRLQARATPVNLGYKQTGYAVLRIAQAAKAPSATCVPVATTYLQIYPPNQGIPLYLAYDSTGCTGMTVELLQIGLVHFGTGG